MRKGEKVRRRSNEADRFCYGIEYHYLPNPSDRNARIFVGSYDLHLVIGGGGWKIDKFKFDLEFIEGNKYLGGSSKQD